MNIDRVRFQDQMKKRVKKIRQQVQTCEYGLHFNFFFRKVELNGKRIKIFKFKVLIEKKKKNHYF